MLTFTDLDMVPMPVLTRVVLASGEEVAVGEDDCSLPFAEEIDDYPVSVWSDEFLASLTGDAGRIARNYSRGILTGRECDEKLAHYFGQG